MVFPLLRRRSEKDALKGEKKEKAPKAKKERTWRKTKATKIEPKVEEPIPENPIVEGSPAIESKTEENHVESKKSDIVPDASAEPKKDEEPRQEDDEPTLSTNGDESDADEPVKNLSEDKPESLSFNQDTKDVSVLSDDDVEHKGDDNTDKQNRGIESTEAKEKNIQASQPWDVCCGILGTL